MLYLYLSCSFFSRPVTVVLFLLLHKLTEVLLNQESGVELPNSDLIICNQSRHVTSRQII